MDIKETIRGITSDMTVDERVNLHFAMLSEDMSEWIVNHSKPTNNINVGKNEFAYLASAFWKNIIIPIKGLKIKIGAHLGTFMLVTKPNPAEFAKTAHVEYASVGATRPPSVKGNEPAWCPGGDRSGVNQQ